MLPDTFCKVWKSRYLSRVQITRSGWWFQPKAQFGLLKGSSHSPSLEVIFVIPGFFFGDVIRSESRFLPFSYNHPVKYILLLGRPGVNRLYNNYIIYIYILFIVVLPSFTQQSKSGRTGVLNSAPTKVPFFLVRLFCVIWHNLI